MNKWMLCAAAAVVMSGSVAGTSQAAVKTYVISGNYGNRTSVSDMLDKCGINIGNGNICVTIPECNDGNTGNWNWDFALPGGGSGTPTPDAPSQGGTTTSDSYVQQVIALVNQERAKAGLAPLVESAQLSRAASVRAEEITRSFSHTRPDGSSFSTVLAQNGVSYNGAGENIAYGQETPEEVMNAWMNSQGHRANILNQNFTTIGVGYVQTGNGTGYWVQLFTY